MNRSRDRSSSAEGGATAAAAAANREASPTTTTLNGEEVAVICVALKVLFNLTHCMNTSVPSEDDKLKVDEETFAQYEEMARVSRLIFNVDADSDDIKDTLIRSA